MEHVLKFMFPDFSFSLRGSKTPTGKASDCTCAWCSSVPVLVPDVELSCGKRSRGRFSGSRNCHCCSGMVAVNAASA